eukprot:6207022-Pleurochrysis_carterae.AAC.2
MPAPSQRENVNRRFVRSSTASRVPGSKEALLNISVAFADNVSPGPFPNPGQTSLGPPIQIFECDPVLQFSIGTPPPPAARLAASRRAALPAQRASARQPGSEPFAETPTMWSRSANGTACARSCSRIKRVASIPSS